MTRLKTNDIRDISCTLHSYDMEVKKTLGVSLEQIAKRAVMIMNNNSINKKDFKPNKDIMVAVIPITSGLGIIDGFSESVRDILRYCGANVFITENSDVAGIKEAYQKGAGLIFMADDNVCASFCLEGKVYSDNGYATGIGFAAALEIMMDGAIGKEVLILGAGSVGIASAIYFSRIGAIPVLCDLIEEKAVNASKNIINSRIETSGNINKYKYILDASTSEGFIKDENVSTYTKISAPGIPLGVTNEAKQKAVVFHNPLELGIMTMYFDCRSKL